MNNGINYQPQLVIAGFLPSTVFWDASLPPQDAIGVNEGLGGIFLLENDHRTDFCMWLLGCPGTEVIGSKVIGSVGYFTPRNTPFITRLYITHVQTIQVIRNQLRDFPVVTGFFFQLKTNELRAPK